RTPKALVGVGRAARALAGGAPSWRGRRHPSGLARCLLADPMLLILDEPMNGLDPAGMLEFRELIRSFVEEGRTVFLSSHLLDEVQRTCDFAAIVDRGRVVTQGPIGALASGARRIAAGSADPRRAAALLTELDGVESTSIEGEDVRVSVAPNGTTDRELVTAIVRRLLEAGVAIDRVSPDAATLEERFLTVTSRLEEDR